MVGTHVDVSNRCPVVQRVLPNVDCHTGIQSNGVAGVDCTALLVYDIAFICLVAVRGAIGK